MAIHQKNQRLNLLSRLAPEFVSSYIYINISIWVNPGESAIIDILLLYLYSSLLPTSLPLGHHDVMGKRPLSKQ